LAVKFSIICHFFFVKGNSNQEGFLTYRPKKPDYFYFISSGRTSRPSLADISTARQN
jgi:hypothetical protein